MKHSVGENTQKEGAKSKRVSSSAQFERKPQKHVIATRECSEQQRDLEFSKSPMRLAGVLLPPTARAGQSVVRSLAKTARDDMGKNVSAMAGFRTPISKPHYNNALLKLLAEVGELPLQFGDFFPQ